VIPRSKTNIGDLPVKIVDRMPDGNADRNDR